MIGDPESRTDPTGQRFIDDNGDEASIETDPSTGNQTVYIYKPDGSVSKIDLRTHQQTAVRKKTQVIPKPETPQQTKQINHESAARNVANTAEGFFYGIEADLNGLLNNWFFWAALAIVAGIPGVGPGIAAGVFAAIGILVKMAHAVGDVFAFEANQKNLGWFTPANIEEQKTNVEGLTVIAAMIAVTAGVSLAGIAALIAAACPHLAPVAALIAAGTVTTGALVAAGGSVLFYNASNYIGQQIADVSSSG